MILFILFLTFSSFNFVKFKIEIKRKFIKTNIYENKEKNESYSVIKEVFLMKNEIKNETMNERSVKYTTFVSWNHVLDIDEGILSSCLLQ